LLDEYKKQIIFSFIFENNFYNFIPNKQFSIPFEFYVNKKNNSNELINILKAEDHILLFDDEKMDLKTKKILISRYK